MNRTLLSIFCLILFSSVIQAQKLTVNSNTLDFDTTLTTQTDTLFLLISNNSGSMMKISKTMVYDTDFEALLNQFNILPGQTLSLPVIFHPRHNIDYNSELVLFNRTGEGNLAVDLKGTGKYTGTYYNSTQGLSEQNLKNALKTLISGQSSLGYNTARDKMFMIIDNQKVNGQGATQNTLDCIYIGKTVSGYSSRQNAYSNYNVNTEHTFPQSKFNSQEPMKSDLFHLYPSDVAANAERGSKPFGTVNNPSWQQGGSKSNNSKFEPRDEQKGPTSRSMLYFLIRYKNYGSFVSTADQNILKQWCLTYLPNQIEQKRCDDIQSFQHNRNPFIDHPEFVERIHSFISTSTAPVVHSLVLTSDTIQFLPAQLGDTLLFRFVMVNNGNIAVNLSGFLLGNGLFSVLSAPDIIAPGESDYALVQYVMTDTFAKIDTMHFNSDVPALNHVEIPVMIKGGIGTGIYSGYNQESIRVFPNPAADQIQIHSNIPESAHIKLFNLNGEMMMQYMLEELSDFRLDCSLLKPGLYLIEIDTEHHRIFKKILIF